MRLPDWQLRLAEFGRARASMPFDWGSNDCCTFTADAVHAITRQDLRAGFPAYAGEVGALRAIAAGGGLQQFASNLLGDPMSPKMAAVGDVVLVLNAEREMLGICNGTGVLAPGMAGMIVVGMDAAIAAWRI